MKWDKESKSSPFSMCCHVGTDKADECINPDHGVYKSNWYGVSQKQYWQIKETNTTSIKENVNQKKEFNHKNGTLVETIIIIKSNIL